MNTNNLRYTHSIIVKQGTEGEMLALTLVMRTISLIHFDKSWDVHCYGFKHNGGEFSVYKIIGPKCIFIEGAYIEVPGVIHTTLVTKPYPEDDRHRQT